MKLDQPQPGGSGAGSTVDLHSTTDGMVWAREFVRIYREKGIGDDPEGWMVGWFANAIEVGRMAGERKLRADLAAAQAEIDRLKLRGDRFYEQLRLRTEMLNDANADLFQNRATLAEARATVERQDAVLHLARVAEKAAEDSEDDGEDEATLDAWYAFHRALAALDRATTEATTSQHALNSPQKAPSRVPAPNHDHTDTENADGPS